MTPLQAREALAVLRAPTNLDEVSTILADAYRPSMVGAWNRSTSVWSSILGGAQPQPVAPKPTYRESLMARERQHYEFARKRLDAFKKARRIR